MSSRFENLADVLASDDHAVARQWVANRKAAALKPLLVEFGREVDRALADRTVEGTRRLVKLHLLLRGCFDMAEPGLPTFVHPMPRSVLGLDLASMLGEEARHPANLSADIEMEGIGPRSIEHTKPNQVMVRVLNYRGCRLCEERAYKEGGNHFDTALRINPGFLPAYCNRARSCLEQENLSGALNDAREIKARDPEYLAGRATVGLIEALAKLKSTRKGASVAQLAHDYGLIGLLRQYDRPRRPGEPPSAPLDLSATRPEPDEQTTAPALNHEGVTAGRAGRMSDALAAFSKAIARDTDYADAWFNRGKVHMLERRWRDAIDDFAQAIRIDPDHDGAHLLLEETREAEMEVAISWPSRSDGSSARRASRGWWSPDIAPVGFALTLADPAHVTAKGRAVSCPDGLLTRSRRLIAIGPPSEGRTYDGLSPHDFAHEKLAAARDRRRRGDYEQARSLYRLALRVLSAARGRDGNLLAALMGLGLNYQGEARTQLVAGVRDFKDRELASEERAIGSTAYLALRAGALRTFWLSKSCSVLALDLVLEGDDVHEQANQVANIAGNEHLMGNLDTALRYARWARAVHSRLGQVKAAEIDANLVAAITKSAGRATLKEGLP